MSGYGAPLTGLTRRVRAPLHWLRARSDGPAALLDPDWYLARYPDVAASSASPRVHFLRYGLAEGRDPNPLFSTSWIVERHPDLAERTAEAFLKRGPAAHISPHPLFDIGWYLSHNPDVAASGLNPLLHYLRFGAAEGRSPTPLFDAGRYRRLAPESATNPLAHYLTAAPTPGVGPNALFDDAWYVERYPDVARSGLNPLLHYVLHGAAEGRDPSAHFDTEFYRRRNGDVVAAGLNPLSHYLSSGGIEGRAPSPRFDGAAYLRRNPDVAAAGLNPLVHFLEHGQNEGRLATAPKGLDGGAGGDTVIATAARYRAAGDVSAATLLDMVADGQRQLLDYFAPKLPLSLCMDAARTAAPTLNVLLPSLQARHATGGPNTAYILGALLAEAGSRVAFVATDLPLDDDLGPLRAHVRQISGVDPEAMDIRFLDASDRAAPLPVGRRDRFMATAWWTAHVAASAARLTDNRAILYLIQDYETLFYGASESFADAEASYLLDHRPVINTTLLRDHLRERGVGRYADPAFAAAAEVFEPAVDRDHFLPSDRAPAGASGRPRRLLFYARPTVARRNMFGLGVAALRAAVEAGMFGADASRWEFVGMGESFQPTPLGRGATLEPAPWMDFAGYARQMRGADVLLSLMLSPHPSYPPLEMAATGGHAVTTVYGAKTAQRLSALSPLIIGAPPTVEGLVDGLGKALATPRPAPEMVEDIALPGSWRESLSGVTARITRRLRDEGFPCRDDAAPLPAPVAIVRDEPGVEDAVSHYGARSAARARLYPPVNTDGLFSLITTVYDTDPQFIADLAHTVFGQSGAPDFEWLILDNGSRNADTRAMLEALTRDRRVRLHRVTDNLGIVGGMRWCLENARNRYVLPLDSDDLLFHDCLSALAAFLTQSDFPALAYTDEDKTDGKRHGGAYLKPDWDPVLFVHSCYVAHLTALDRKTALALGCYSDPAVEGCHDWDSFLRFMSAGHTPAHLAEVLYSWRLHAASTAADFRAKPYVFASHRAALGRFLAARELDDRIALTPSPLFDGTPDYRFASLEDSPLPAPTRVTLDPAAPAQSLRAALKTAPPGMILLRHPDTRDPDPLAAEEAAVLAALFPDAAIIGGRLHDGARLLDGGQVFGYGGGIGCPDVGRPLSDPTEGAQLWKPRSVAAAPAAFCHVDRDFLQDALAQTPDAASPALLGPWLGGLAFEAGRRVICSPHVAARMDRAPQTTDGEMRRFNARFGHLHGESVGYAPLLDRSGAASRRPASGASPALALQAYPDWLGDRLSARTAQARAEAAGGAAPISLLTSVYSRTDVSLFEETATSVARQIVPPAEWVVLINGPIPDALETVLRRLESAGALRLLQADVNLGIHGGLRRCLEAATAVFTVSLDADDLLTDDAVAVLARAIAADPQADAVFTDEDLLIDGRPCHPNLRPGFDPALLLTHSTVWHAIAVRRAAALELGVYTGAEVEYAQDWDTLLRLHAAGRKITHAPEIVYHWRQHARSLSHGGAVFEGSQRASRAALEYARTHIAPDPARFEVADYPIDLGAPSLHLRRKPASTSDVVAVWLGPRRDGAPAGAFPFADTVEIDLLGSGGVGALSAVLGSLGDRPAMLLGPAVRRLDAGGVWQALGRMEIMPDCAAVCGPLVAIGGQVLASGIVALSGNRLADPAAGQRWGAPGPFSIEGLAHSVLTGPIDLTLGRADWLAEALEARPTSLGARAAGLALARAAAAQGRRIVCEPLMRADVGDPRAVIADPVEGIQRAWRAHGLVAPPGRQGAAGWLNAAGRFAP